MKNISGKVLVFTDLHIGLKNAQKNRLAICELAVEKMVKYIKDHDVKNVIFLGDWNHSRVSTENNALNISYKLMKLLASNAKVYAILGNHDIYMKNSLEINSLVVFKDISNVEIIDSVTPISINGNMSLLVPWLGNISGAKENSFDMLFGHFDISSKFLIKSFVEEHNKKHISNELASELCSSLEDKIDNSADDSENKCAISFVDLAKSNGKIFAGHIHNHKEFFIKGRWFSFVGSPYQQNLGEIDSKCGFYIVDENNNVEFKQLEGIPKHINLLASDMIKSDFDFSIVTGNIIHKIYDIELDLAEDAKISQKINDLNPYEELVPDYQVPIKSIECKTSDCMSSEIMKKSKLEYIKNYINNIDSNILKKEKIDAKKLIAILEKYYNAAIGEQ